MPFPVRQLEADGRTYRVEGGPLPKGSGASGWGEKRLARPSAQVLKLGPGADGWYAGLMCFGVAGGLGTLWRSLLHEWNPGAARDVKVWVWVVLLLVVLPVALVFFGLYRVTDYIRFDRGTGRAVRRRFFRTVWATDLQDVLAVQCLHAGWHAGKRSWSAQYQVNLALKREGDSRLHVDTAREEEAARSLAEELAGFLQVPLVDQVAETRTLPPLKYEDSPLHFLRVTCVLMVLCPLALLAGWLWGGWLGGAILAVVVACLVLGGAEALRSTGVPEGAQAAAEQAVEFARQRYPSEVPDDVEIARVEEKRYVFALRYGQGFRSQTRYFAVSNSPPVTVEVVEGWAEYLEQSTQRLLDRVRRPRRR